MKKSVASQRTFLGGRVHISQLFEENAKFRCGLRRSMAINRFIGRTHPLLLVYVLSEDLVRKKHSPPLKQAMLKSSSRNVL